MLTNEKKDYNNEFCGSVPLHNVNLIQSYGYLLVIDARNRTIVQVSENVEELFRKPLRELVNTLFDDYLEVSSLQQLKEIINSGLKQRVPFSISFKNEGAMQAILHVQDDYLIFEIEKASSQHERYFTNVFQELKYSIALIEQADTVQKACETAIRELKKVSGFDGVLMYQFDKDWNGTVIAEHKDERLEPYLGQTFPASDIPKQARDLYLKNPYRLIPDREFTPIKLFPVINPITNTFINLSECNLRSVPAVHLEYMRNMGIKASMSIRVIRNGQLWGLISCHHIEPIHINFETCSIFELFSSVISNKISSMLNKEEYDYLNNLTEKKARLIEQVYAGNDISRGLVGHEGESILDLFGADGAVVAVNGKMDTIGKVPDADAIENLVFWLEGKSVNKVFAVENLTKLYDDASDYIDKGSGILVIPIDHTRGEYIICFRPEAVETINWGGNPNEALTFEKDGRKYHPRNSFKLWKQQVRNTSLPWQKELLETADSLKGFLFEFRTRQLYN